MCVGVCGCADACVRVSVCRRASLNKSSPCCAGLLYTPLRSVTAGHKSRLTCQGMNSPTNSNSSHWGQVVPRSFQRTQQICWTSSSSSSTSSSSLNWLAFHWFCSLNRRFKGRTNSLHSLHLCTRCTGVLVARLVSSAPSLNSAPVRTVGSSSLTLTAHSALEQTPVLTCNFWSLNFIREPFSPGLEL